MAATSQAELRFNDLGFLRQENLWGSIAGTADSHAHRQNGADRLD